MKMRRNPIHFNDARMHREAGFGAIAAIVIVVMLSTLAAAIVRMSWSQQVSFTQDVMGARAFQAANAGTEWGMYQALKGTWSGAGCAGSSTNLDLRADTGFRVTVTCSTKSYSEGQVGGGGATPTNVTVQLYVIDAVACNGAASSCPDNASIANVTYVERKRQTVVSQSDNGF